MVRRRRRRRRKITLSVCSLSRARELAGMRARGEGESEGGGCIEKFGNRKNSKTTTPHLSPTPFLTLVVSSFLLALSLPLSPSPPRAPALLSRICLSRIAPSLSECSRCFRNLHLLVIVVSSILSLARTRARTGALAFSLSLHSFSASLSPPLSLANQLHHSSNFRKMIELLCPPNPKEFDKTTFVSLSSAAPGPTTMLMSMLGSGSSTFKVGWILPVTIACTAATASTAPAAPSRWPIIDLVPFTRTWFPGMAPRIALNSATSPAGVEVAWALT
jgi:hypothetical protein